MNSTPNHEKGPGSPEDTPASDPVDEDREEQAFSLEELGAAFASALGGSDAPESPDQAEDAIRQALHDARRHRDSSPALGTTGEDDASEIATPEDQADDAIATPEMIVEAALFIGHPQNQSLSAPRLASIMRDVTPEEVVEVIDSLNESYRQEGQGIRIVSDEAGGYRMVVAPEVEDIKLAFSGRVRETRLNQPAIDVLSLVAYQPGITAAEVTDRRGRDSGALLNQMVRRRLVEVRREVDEPKEKKAANTDSPIASRATKRTKTVAHFYPAERLWVLLGLDSIDDLPMVEETRF
ncbi:MAG: SMC-Scp complex subunit ScpB [Planctomycetota bacterium]